MAKKRKNIRIELYDSEMQKLADIAENECRSVERQVEYCLRIAIATYKPMGGPS